MRIASHMHSFEAPPETPPRWSRRPTWRPGVNGLHRLLGKRPPDILTAAVDRWQIAPGNVVEVRPAKKLGGQLYRIRGAEFGGVAEVVRDFIGGFGAMQPPTMGYRLKNVLLTDGVLYAGDAVRHLQRRSARLPVHLVPHDLLDAVLYESWLGNRWFGNWLSDDCLTHDLAAYCGQPFTARAASGHMTAYERALGMHPLRRASARFAELILFDDQSHNDHKRQRADLLRLRLTGGRIDRHPGIFLLRGRSGAPRVLANEQAIAERLAVKRGFTILDPSTASLEEIVRLCGGASVVAGVEGSHLVHGLAVMPPDARAFVIQPPDRAVSALKRLTDRQGQDYSMLVGVGTHEAFIVDGDEVERTLDLA